MAIVLGYGKRVLGRAGDQREQGRFTWPRESLHSGTDPKYLRSLPHTVLAKQKAIYGIET